MHRVTAPISVTSVPTTNIFNTITQAAIQAPAYVPTPQAAAFNGRVLEPSQGWQLPVAPATKTLKSYQAAAVEVILDVHPRVVLGYQPGMGKTAILQAVAAARAAKGEKTICIVPPSLRVSPWAEEFALDYPHLKVTLVEGMSVCKVCGKSETPHTRRKNPVGHLFQPEANPVDPTADVAIVGDSVIQSRLQDLLDFGATTVTLDEAHRFKNRTAKRTIAALALADSMTVTSVVAATGTLATNHAGDVYSPLRITGRNNAKAVSRGDSWTRFMDEWCETEMVWTGRAHVKVVTGCRDAEGLRQKLLDTCMLSVPREEVLDLPERTFAIRNLVLNGDAALYRRMEKDFLNWVRDTKGEPAYKRAKKAEAIQKLLALWEQDGLAKAAATSEYVEALAEQGEQVVVMAWHTKVITDLYGKLTKAGLKVSTIIGGMTSEQKAAAVTKFQAGETDVIIGQIEAAGTGLTLHKACNIVFAQLPWSPASFAQASDRIYRIGQVNRCTIHVLNGVDMVSQRLWDVVQAKAQITDAINTGTESTIDYESIEDAVLSGYGW